MNKQQGFTIIELVVVIVILGILAAIAAPKFLNLQGDARRTVIQGVEGALRGAASIVHAKALIAGGDPASVTADGNTYTVSKRYPAAGSITTATGSIVQLNPAADFTLVTSGTPVNAVEIRHARAATPANCYVRYTEPATLGAEPSYATDYTGC